MATMKGRTFKTGKTQDHYQPWQGRNGLALLLISNTLPTGAKTVQTLHDFETDFEHPTLQKSK